jgi:hypothetical protein
MTDSTPQAAGGRPWVDPRLRPVLAALLGAVGVEFWLIAADGLWGRVGQVRAVASVFVVSLILVAIPPLRNGLTAALERLRSPSRTSRRVIAVGVALLSMGYLFWTARHQGRAFAPAVKDEYCYLIQARQIAGGRLWMPKHAVADAFDTFYMISDPVYASKYFPGTAVALAAALKLGLPPWSASLALSGAAVGLLYLLLTELLDGWAGLLGSVLLLSMQMFRRLSVAYMSQPLLLVLALGAVLAYLRWRGEARAGRSGLGWMAVIGACVGGAVVTRPLDAVCVAAAPLAVAILFDVRSPGLRRAAAAVAVAAVAAGPLAALQLACNRGITGRWLETPWTFYARHDDPYDALGWRAVTPDVHTRSVLPQKRLAEEQFTIPAHRQRLEVPFFRLFLHKRLQYLMDDVLPWAPLVALIPVGVLALAGRPGRAVVWAGLPLLALGYTFHTVYLSHYAVAAAPATIFAVLAGAWAIVGAMPGARAAGAAGVVLSALLLTAAVTAFPEVTGERADEFETAQELRAIDRATAGLADAPSIVLFRFGPGANPLVEPVYNADVGGPDDAGVTRAHDLGDAADARLMAYYATRDPGRRVYRYDRSAVVTGERLRYLGTVGELAKGLRGDVKR